MDLAKWLQTATSTTKTLTRPIRIWLAWFARASFKLHKDATLAFRDGANAAGIKYRLADSVSVLYVAVPDGMVGGELELKDPRASTTTSSNITPKENTCCVFRGDAEHAVHNFFTSNTTQDRVSVVLEQYKVPVGETEWLLEFEKVDQNRYMTTRL